MVEERHSPSQPYDDCNSESERINNLYETDNLVGIDVDCESDIWHPSLIKSERESESENVDATKSETQNNIGCYAKQVAT